MSDSATHPPYGRRQRAAMARAGLAIPITNDAGEILDGSCPIATRDDLALAIKNLSTAPDRRAARLHIRTRAEVLGSVDLLPRSWRAPPHRRPGRPLGSVSLTREREDQIVGLIRRGVFPHVAADLAGVSARALREWVARGEGRSSRPSTPKLRTFAQRYRQAHAEARALAEARVYNENVLKWLSHAAPTRDGLPGWTSPPEGSGAEEGVRTPVELKELITGIRNDLLYADRTALVPECLNRRCRCVFHRPRTPEELDRLRAMAARRRTAPGSSR